MSKFPEVRAFGSWHPPRPTGAPAGEKYMSIIETGEAVSFGPSGRKLEPGEEESLFEKLGCVGHIVPLITSAGHKKDVLPEEEGEKERGWGRTR